MSGLASNAKVVLSNALVSVQPEDALRISTALATRSGLSVLSYMFSDRLVARLVVASRELFCVASPLHLKEEDWKVCLSSMHKVGSEHAQTMDCVLSMYPCNRIVERLSAAMRNTLANDDAKSRWSDRRVRLLVAYAMWCTDSHLALTSLVGNIDRADMRRVHDEIESFVDDLEIDDELHAIKRTVDAIASSGESLSRTV
jgi:hypothetical protein